MYDKKYIVVEQEMGFDKKNNKTIMYVEAEYEQLRQAVGKSMVLSKGGMMPKIYKLIDWDVKEKV